MLVAASTATFIAAASAAAAVGTLLAYVHFSRRAQAHAARDEALALAETRGQIIVELQAQLRDLHARNTRLERMLAATRDEAREHAYQIQRFYAIALIDLLRDVRRDLEQAPPDVDAALARIREVVPDGRSAA